MVTRAVSMSCSCTFAPQAPHVLVPPAYSPAVGVAIGKLAFHVATKSLRFNAAMNSDENAVKR